MCRQRTRRDEHEQESKHAHQPALHRVSEFTKARTEGPHSAVEDAESDRRIGGELSYPVDGGGLPGPSDPYEGSEIAAESAEDAIAILRQAGMTDGDPESGADESAGGEDEDDAELVGAGAGGRRRRGR